MISILIEVLKLIADFISASAWRKLLVFIAAFTYLIAAYLIIDYLLESLFTVKTQKHHELRIHEAPRLIAVARQPRDGTYTCQFSILA